MSYALFDKAGLRFWTEKELEMRRFAVEAIVRNIKDSLRGRNRGWEFVRCETPMILPRGVISSNYTADDVFFTGEDQQYAMRPETTAGSYMVADQLLKSTKMKLPLCVYQYGKSYRVEKADGASASKYRYNEFTQLEFQCVYSHGTMADYRTAVQSALGELLGWFCCSTYRFIESDRLPSYSEKTMDIEVLVGDRWVEVCSISDRTDFADAKVLEIAVGIDRVVDIGMR